MGQRSLLIRLTITTAAIAACVLVLAFTWLGSSSGLDWAAQKIIWLGEGAITAEGIEGSLLDEVRIRKLQVRNDDFGLEAEIVVLRWQPLDLLRRELHLSRASASLLRYRNLSTTPSKLPTSLALPLDISIAALEINRLEISNLPAIENLKLGYAGGRNQHDIRLLQTQSEGWTIDGVLQVNALSPFQTNGQIQATRGTTALAMQAKAGITGTLEALQVKLSGGGRGTSIESSAVLRPYAAQPLDRLDAHARDLDLSAWNDAWPRTRINFDATAKSIDQLLTGTLHAENSANGTLNSGRLPLSTVDARFTGSDNTWRLPTLDVQLSGGGRVSGSAAVSNGAGSMDIQFRGIDAARIDSRLRSIKVSGSAKISGNPESQSAMAKLDGAGVQLQFSANQAGGTLTVDRAHLQAGAGTADIKGRLELKNAQAFDFSGTFSRLDPSKLAAIQPATLNGRISANGKLQPEWQAQVDINLVDSRLRNLPFNAHAAFATRKSHWFDGNAQLAIGRNRAEIKGGYGKPQDQLRWTVEAEDLRALDTTLGGRITGNGSVTGATDGPALDFTIEGQQLAYGNQRMARLDAQGMLGAGRDGALRVSATASGLQISETLVDNLRLSGNGSRTRHTIDGSVQGADGNGTLRATGGLDAQGRWTGSLDQLELKRPWPLRLSAPAQITAGSGILVIEQLRANLLDGEFGPATLRAEKGRINTNGAFRGISVARLLPRNSGLVDAGLRLGGQWALALENTWTGKASLHRESGDLSLTGEPPVPLALRKALLNLNAADSGIDIAADIDSGAMGTAAGQLQTRLIRKDGVWMLPGEAPLSGTINLDFRSMAWLRALLPGLDRIDGLMAARIRAEGTVATPRFSGTITGNQLLFRAVGPGLDLRDGRLRATLEDTRFRLDEFELKAGKGRITANGTADLTGGLRSIDLAARAEHAQILLAPQWSAIIDGTGRLGFRDRRVTLEGRFGLDEGRYDLGAKLKPGLSDDVIVRTGKPETVEKAAALPIKLDIGIDLQDKLTVRGNGLDALLGGSLRITNRGAALSAVGDVQTVRGNYTVFGQQLQIDRGTVAFAGPLTDPGLDLRAIRKFQAVEVGVEVTGSLQRPTVKLVSIPDMSDTDRLGWLALGRDPAGSDRAQLAVLQAAVLSLTGSGGKPVQKQIAEGIGLDEIGFAGGENGALGVVALGKKLTDKLSIRLEQTLGGTAGSLLRMDYLLSERWRLRGTAGAENAGDILFTIRFD
jgi:translocation and assembly module TamB